MICDISTDLVKILNYSIINGEILSENMFFHLVFVELLRKLQKNNKIHMFYIKKSRFTPYLQELNKISKIFPFFVSISDEYPIESDELICILQKYKEKFSKNMKKFYKFLVKHKLLALEQAYIKENIRFTLFTNNLN